MEKNQLIKNVTDEEFLKVIKDDIIGTWYNLLYHEVFRCEITESDGEVVGFTLGLEDKLDGNIAKAEVVFFQDTARTQTTYAPAGMEKPMFRGMERRYRKFLAEKFGEYNK